MSLESKPFDSKYRDDKSADTISLDVGEPASGGASAFERLRGQLARFGGKTALVVVGFGLIVLALGYNGIAGANVNHAVLVQAQLPYLISGGAVGVSLVVFGSALLVVQAAREDRVRLEARLTQLVELAQAQSGVSVAPDDATGLVAAGSSSYHVPSCRLVDGREEVDYLTPAEARERKLKPCRVCRPDTSGANVTVR